jgi:hypothetical protein
VEVSDPGEESWWKWAGIPRFRRRVGDIPPREWRDIFWGVLISFALLVVGLMLLAAVVWLVQH